MAKNPESLQSAASKIYDWLSTQTEPKSTLEVGIACGPKDKRDKIAYDTDALEMVYQNYNNKKLATWAGKHLKKLNDLGKIEWLPDLRWIVKR